MQKIRERRSRGSGIFKGELPHLDKIKSRMELDQNTLNRILGEMKLEGEFWVGVATSINEVKRIFRPGLISPRTAEATRALLDQLKDDRQSIKNALTIGKLFRRIKEAKIERLIESGERIRKLSEECGISENAIGVLFRKIIGQKGKKITKKEIENAIEKEELFGEKLAKGNFYGHPLAKIINKKTGRSYCDIYFSQNEIREVVHKLRGSKIAKLKEEGMTEKQIARKLEIQLTRIISEKSATTPRGREREIVERFRDENKGPTEIATELRIKEDEVYRVLEKFGLVEKED